MIILLSLHYTQPILFPSLSRLLLGGLEDEGLPPGGAPVVHHAAPRLLLLLGRQELVRLVNHPGVLGVRLQRSNFS